MNILELRNVSKSFPSSDSKDQIHILSKIDLTVSCGTSVAVVGKSGTGKSTLLHLCGALDKPNFGTIVLNGKDFSKLSDKQLSMLRNEEIGFIFQSHLLMEDFTAIENVIIPALISKRPKKQSIENAEALLEKVGLKDRMRHFPGQLSGGEKQRIAICRALINNPSLILADEPTGSLDEENAFEIENLLLDIVSSEHKTLLLVTHNNDFSKKCGKVYILKNKTLRALS